jgi:hypothetical protein
MDYFTEKEPVLVRLGAKRLGLFESHSIALKVVAANPLRYPKGTEVVRLRDGIVLSRVYPASGAPIEREALAQSLEVEVPSTVELIEEAMESEGRW